MYFDVAHSNFSPNDLITYEKEINEIKLINILLNNTFSASS